MKFDFVEMSNLTHRLVSQNSPQFDTGIKSSSSLSQVKTEGQPLGIKVTDSLSGPRLEQPKQVQSQILRKLA